MVFLRFPLQSTAMSHRKMDYTHSERQIKQTTAEMEFLWGMADLTRMILDSLGRVKPRPAHCSVFTHCKEDSRIYIMCRFYTFTQFWCPTGDLNKEISKWIQCLFLVWNLFSKAEIYEWSHAFCCKPPIK